MSVKGHASNYFGRPCIIRSLELKTNLDVYGPYGQEVGKTFEFLAPPLGKIIGFHARSAQFLIALGVYVQVCTTITIFISTPKLILFLCCPLELFCKLYTN